MGLFSSKKTITVSSTLYNMAGDERDRPDYLKGTVFSSMISGSPSIADDITKSYFQGPGLQQKQFFKYCDREDMRGLPTATVVNNLPLDPAVVALEIPASPVPPAPADLILRAFNAEVNDGDFESWIERWILLNHPERIIEDWLGEFEPATNTFSVEFPNNDFFSWLNTDAPVYDPSKRYITAKYIEYTDDSSNALVEGTPTTGVLTLPDVTGWTQTVDTPSFTPVTLQRVRNTVLSYNNGDPDVQVETDVDADIAGELRTDLVKHEREIVIQQNGIEVQGEYQQWTFTNTDIVVGGYVDVVITTTDLGGGVIETRTETTTGEQVQTQWKTQYDTQDIFMGQQYGPEQIFIYEIGTGNTTLDALVGDADATGFQEFFPFMPVRINNVSILDSAYDNDTGNGLYDELSRAYKRGFGYKNSFESLVDKVEDNESLPDIDYAYLCFGASLNVEEQACRRYIFKFFEEMIPFQTGGSGNVISNLQTEVGTYETALQDLQNWEANIAAASNGDIWTDIPDRPEIPAISPPPTNTIKLNDSDLGFDYRLQWVHIEVEQFPGNYETLAGLTEPAKLDQVELVAGPGYSWTERTSFNTRDGELEQLIQKNIPSMYIYWQVDSNSYRRMEVWGLTSYNYIYGGKAVTITSTEALEDTEESGFLVPLHYPTMNAMGIVDYTQMSTANSHIMFNSYEVTKQRWYERGIFKILLVIVILIIAVIVFPGAFSAGGGILGGNLAVGAALGLSGTAALVAGVIANYVASIIIAELLKIVGTTLFGEKWGALFAALAGFAFGMAMSGTSLFSAQGLLGLSGAAANGYAGWVQGDIAEMQEALEDDREAYEDRMDEIQDLLDQLTSGNGLNFNPIFLTDSGRGNGRRGSRGYLPETADEYIRRTTMTGSDIVDLSFAMVYDYVDVQKALPRN